VIREHVRLSDVLSIARRWFVTNAFDGSLSILGLILGANAIGSPDPNFILGAGLGICGALAISQSSGNVMAERAERLRELRSLQRSMLRTLEDSIHTDAAATAPVIAGLIGGAAPAAYTALTLTPYALHWFKLLDAQTAFYASIAGILIAIFFLGTVLGRISRSSVVVSGAKMVGVGLITALILFALGSI
jgi:predicted membrane protein (TIGR00267 family)